MAMLYRNPHYSEACYNEVVLYVISFHCVDNED